MQEITIFTGAFPGLRKFLAIESPLKIMKSTFISH